MAGVRQGMDSVHIDLSISKDDVPFLLRDHDPRSLTAGLRQLGVWGVARCRPAMASDSLVPAHDKLWKLRMKRNIVFVSGLGMDVKSLSAEQREGVERLLKSQAMGFIRDKEDEAMYAILVDQLRGEQIISVESGELNLDKLGTGYQVMEIEKMVDSVMESSVIGQGLGVNGPV